MREKDYKNAINNILSDESSKNYLIDILIFCCPLELNISDNDRKDIFRLGVKTVGVKILDDILLYSPEKYTEIVQKMKGFE